MEAVSFPCPHPLPTSELPARVSRAAAPSLGWHRISICLVKLKVCTAPKSELAGQRGTGSRELRAPQQGSHQQDHTDHPLLFIASTITPAPPPSPSKGPTLALGQIEKTQCRENAEKLRMLSTGWPWVSLGRQSRYLARIPEQPTTVLRKPLASHQQSRTGSSHIGPLLGGTDGGTPLAPSRQTSFQRWARPGVPFSPRPRGSHCPPT